MTDGWTRRVAVAVERYLKASSTELSTGQVDFCVKMVLEVICVKVFQLTLTGKTGKFKFHGRGEPDGVLEYDDGTGRQEELDVKGCRERTCGNLLKITS